MALQGWQTIPRRATLEVHGFGAEGNVPDNGALTPAMPASRIVCFQPAWVGAKKLLNGHDIQRELEDGGIIAIARSRESLAEEASLAYKDVADVMKVAEEAGLSRQVARLRPLGVIKG